MTGDGHADLLVTENQIFTWYPSLAEEGFGPSLQTPQPDDEEAGPRLLLADTTQSIYLADMSGDGLTDLVRIRNGEICYWPNLGYGRFGAKVGMDNAPRFDSPDLFDHSRIRLADVDGSGIADILYLNHQSVDLYLNQAGNAWSDVHVVDYSPRIDCLSDVSVTDLFGNGTACLVWSSPLPEDRRRCMRYIDLMGGQKPHLLVGTSNNLGTETRVRYASSTRFYLEDKTAGRPWITRLPFPVHTVERVETYDHVSRNRYSSRYAYHHGYFDGVEREFRGFAMVEQWDTEELGALSGGDTFPDSSNQEKSSHVPPVYSKTWFHTGVYLGRNQVSNHFAGMLNEQDTGEYYREPGLNDEEAGRLLLPDTILPEGLTVDEEREACRALKGSMLRQEVYALDGTEQQPHPYVVTERNFTVRTVQRRAGNRHAVFLTHPRETLNYHYERNPADPRISHSLTLAVDDFGQVLQSATIGYGRRHPDSDLDPPDRQVQARQLMTCAEHTYTNSIDEDDDYRVPLPSESVSYELTGLALDSGQVRLGFGEVGAAVDSATRIEYHQIADEGLQKRVLEEVRTVYRPDDLGTSRNDSMALLPLGVLEPAALSGVSYTLSFTDEHLDRLFGDRVTETMLVDEGHYFRFPNEVGWWIPSGRVFFSPSLEDGASEELSFGREHFFLPLRYQDPFGQTVTAEYDQHDLMIVQTLDPLENTLTARHDYRLLAPVLLTDPNGNRAAVAFDVLGLVTGTAVMGKQEESVGDSLNGFQAQLTQAQVDAFFAEPRGPTATQLLGSATTRFIYDEHRFQRLGSPAFAATIARQTHVSELNEGDQTVVQVALSYSDGFGRIIQSKVQAEPGPVEEGGDSISPRWTTSGWTVFNNKGKPVKQYEPFFSADHAFEFGVTVGVSPILFYDPIGRVVATLRPNHTWEKVVFDSWSQEGWDVNDTVLIANPGEDIHVGGYFVRLDDADYLPTWHQARSGGDLGPSEQDAADKAAAHAGTPTVSHFDSLGRPFLTIADNGADGRYETRTERDIEGATLRVVDPRGNSVMVYQKGATEPGNPSTAGYDVAGRQFFGHSMDGGDRWVLTDIAGKAIRSWDGRGHRLRNRYDALRRPTHLFVESPSGDELLAERTVYGEVHPEAARLNIRGEVYRQYDSAGVVTSESLDFKGNPLRKSRRLTREYRQNVDWSPLSDLTEIDAIEQAGSALLESEIFSTATGYDALNRPVSMTAPDGSVTRPAFNEGNLLESVAVTLSGNPAERSFVNHIDYNARGQPEHIALAMGEGGALSRTYRYEPDTFRLSRLRTNRERDGAILQDLNYTYDPAGNLTAIHDHAQQTVFFDNVRVDPQCDYSYDPLYRLLQARGREHAARNNIQRDSADFAPVIGIPFPNSPEALQRYVEQYAYDEVGNILRMTHRGGGTLRWKRCYQYAHDSNRLLATGSAGEFQNPADPCPEQHTSTPTLSNRYNYDAHGNVVRMPHLPLMRWNFKDQLQATSSQVVNGGIPETTYYVYDSSGQRVRKVTEREASDDEAVSRSADRLYLGGFEVYREYGGDENTITLERKTLHIMGDQKTIALVDTRTEGDDGSPVQITRYQLDNHLGSAVLEITDQANIISYEEYHPYGTSAYQSGRSVAEVSLKRYRYTGKERDEETSLYYHGARYYACWLARWTAVDPAGLNDGLNLYAYVGNTPLTLVDQSGTRGRPTEQEIGNYERDAEAHNRAVRTWHAEVATFDSDAKNAKYTARRLERERNELVRREQALWNRWFDLYSRTVSADIEEWKQRIQQEIEEGGPEFMNFGRATKTRIAGGIKLFGGLTGMLIPSGASQAVGADFFQAGLRQTITGEESDTVMRSGGALISEAAGNSPRVAAVHGEMSEALISAGAAGAEMGISAVTSPAATLLPAKYTGTHFTPAIRRFAYYSDRTAIPASHAAYTARQSASSVMGQSATNVTNISRSQWLHMLARRFGGGETSYNLAAGTFEANYQMGRFEATVNHLEGLGKHIEYTGTLRGQTLRLRLVSDDKLILNLRLDIRTQVVAPRGSSNIFNKSFSFGN